MSLFTRWPLAVVCSSVSAGATASGQEPFQPHVEPASEEGARAMESFELAEGLRVELWAAEPMLANPVCLYVDFQGRLLVGETFRHYAGVTDMREHMNWLDDDLANETVEDRVRMLQKHEGERFEDYGKAYDRLSLIRDDDDDGKADFHSVFADGFDKHSAGIGAGVLSYKGDVYYTCIPDLWLLNDDDGDGVSDRRRVLSTGYGVNIALLGHDLHGLRIGPDRRLYFSSGDRGFHVETENGVLAHPHTGAVLRCNLDGSDLEVWHTGLRNPQELVFTEYGDLFTGDNNSDGGDKARWVHIVEGADSGWRYSYQWIESPNLRGPWNAEKLWHPHHPGQAAYIVPPIENLASGPSGLAYYPGTGLSDSYQGHFFLCDFRGNPSFSGIHTFTTKRKGAFWELGPVERFVWGTLVTDADFGPDGAMYLTDWVQGWNKTGKGRVYRIVDPEVFGSDPVKETSALLAAGMTSRTPEELVALLRHADMRVRQEAQFELVDRGATGRAALERVASSSDHQLARLHAIWGLGIVGRSDVDALAAIVPLTTDQDSEVRAQALRVLGDERYGEAAASFVAGLGDGEARVRFFAALGAGRVGATAAVEPLAAVLRDTGETDPNLRHAAVMGLLNCATAQDLERLARHESPFVRMGVLQVHRRREDPIVARFLSDADPRLVVEAARAIHDVPIEGAMSELAALARISAAGFDDAALSRRVINANFRLGGTPAVQSVAGVAGRDDVDDAIREEALSMLGGWAEPSSRDRVHNAWRPIEPRDDGEAVRGVIEALASQANILGASERVVVAYLRTVGKAGAASSGAVLLPLVSDDSRPSAVRLAAFDALEALSAIELPAALDLALGDADGRLRARGLSALERLSPAEALPRIPAILALGELSERRAAYGILGGSGDPAASEILAEELEKLRSDLVPAELALDLVLAAEAQTASGDQTVRASLAAYTAPREKDPEIKAYLDSLFGGDVKKGKSVFRKTDLSCVRCHAVDGKGAADMVGPDLAGVSGRLTRLQMLESVLVPNRRTTPGYQGTVLFLHEGGVLNGRILEETDTTIRIQNSDGEVTEVAIADVEDRRPDLSAMPNALGDSISRTEMRDLLAYLSTL